MRRPRPRRRLPALPVHARLVPDRAHQRQLDAERGADRHQRVHHVVVRPDVGQACAARVAAPILGDRQHVGERLAGMVEVAAHVDHRHRRASDHLDQIGVALQPRHDEGAVAREVPRLRADVAEGEVRCAPVEVDGVPAQLRHARLERYPGAGGGLLEEHHQGAALKTAPELRRSLLTRPARASSSRISPVVPELPVDEVFRCSGHASGSPLMRRSATSRRTPPARAARGSGRKSPRAKSASVPWPDPSGELEGVGAGHPIVPRPPPGCPGPNAVHRLPCEGADAGAVTRPPTRGTKGGVNSRNMWSGHGAMRRVAGRAWTFRPVARPAAQPPGTRATAGSRGADGVFEESPCLET